MNEIQQDNSSMKTSTQQINEKNISTNKSPKKNITEKIKKFQLFICIKGCFNNLYTKWYFYLSKCLLLIQFLLFLIPLSLLLFFSIYILHYFGYERIFKFDYFYGVENEYLRYLISEIDEIHFELGSKEIKSQFEDIDNLYFFEIYFQELISMGLLDEDPYQKIYPDISSSSEKLYESYNNFNQDNNINNIYTIPGEEAEEFLDNRGDSLSEIGKIYYFFLPLITYEAITKNTYINQTFLIAYEFDINSKEIIGEDYLYFTFPKKNNELTKTTFFYPSNSFISPRVSQKEVEHGEKFNDSFYKENWFIQQDYNFRKSANADKSFEINFSNLNYNYYGKLNKSNIVSLQSYYHTNKKSYIVNIVYYINQKELNEEYLEFSSFLLINDTLDDFEVEKYSDNDTFLISKLKIAELTLSSTIKEYFHFGMYDKNNNFFKEGVSFDTLNLENLGEPLEYYNSIENFNIDLRYFSSLYLYSSLFKKLSYNKTHEATKDLTEIVFMNENGTVYNICEQIDFATYMDYLEDIDIDCFDNNNLLYYSEKETEEDIFHFNYNTMPYCICLPLYCLKNLEYGFDENNIEYIDEMKLPDKCRNHFLNYLNGIEDNYNNSEENPFLELNFGINNIKILTQDIKKNIENEFYIYKTMKFSQVPNIIFMIVTLVDNSAMKELLSDLIAKLDSMKSYYLLIVLIGMLTAYTIGNFMIIRNIFKISKVIFDYQKIHEKYLNELESSSNKEENSHKKNTDNFNYNSSNKMEKINDIDNLGLTKNEKNILTNNEIYNNTFSNDNSLLNDLLMIYIKYYNISKEELIKINHESKRMNKKDKNEIKKEGNELFKLLRIISFYLPKFKLNVSMDYNFYVNSKLNINYLKSITKERHENQQLIIFTQSVIYELLSTEKIESRGVITNFRFKYITNINFNPKKDNSSIKNSMFSFIEKSHNLEKQFTDNIINNNNNNNEILIEGENKKDNIKIIWKEKNKILEDFEYNFENDDYLKKDKLNSAFDSYIINAYYKYLKKIIFSYNSSSKLLEEKDE